MWWWRRLGNEWASCPDENSLKRVERERKLVRHKYAKELRRRALWAHEPTGRRPSRVWQTPGDPIRSEETTTVAESKQAPGSTSHLQDQEQPSILKPMENQYAEDFARFKASIDKDPFGAVFGKRLSDASQPKSNEAWASLWSIFEPQRESGNFKGPQLPRATDKDSQAKVQANGEKGSSMSQSNKSPDTIPVKTFVSSKNTVPAATEEEYEFDPISMRKVPRVKPSITASPTPSNTPKPLLETLFGEHGVEIPVKTYKPHKVYGYVGKVSPEPDIGKDVAQSKRKEVKKGFESSRLRELQKLKAATLGTNLDTTAEYFGKYSSAEEKADTSKQQTRKAESPAAPDENAPPFSGTTYEAKSKAIIAATPNTDWLTQEGFNDPQDTTPISQELAPEKTKPRKSPVSSDKIQPSLDRMRAPGTALDHINRMAKPDKPLKQPENEVEDMDLLRASDVRASSKAARKTKHDIECERKETRERLEADYASRQRSVDNILIEIPGTISVGTQKLSESINSLWHRLRQQPSLQRLGLVANKVRSMPILKDLDSRHGRPSKSAEDVDARPVSANETRIPTKPAITKTANTPRRSIDTFTPSQEVVNAERESKTRTEALRVASANARKQEAMQRVRAGKLADEIRKAYESQYGAIDVNHRQIEQASHSPMKESVLAPPKPVVEVPKAVSRNEAFPADVGQDRLVKSAESTKTKTPAPMWGKKTSELPVEEALDKGELPSEDVSVANKIVPQVPYEPGIVSSSGAVDEKAKLQRPHRWLQVQEELKNTRRVLHEAHTQIKAVKSCRPLTHWNASSVGSPVPEEKMAEPREQEKTNDNDNGAKARGLRMDADTSSSSLSSQPFFDEPGHEPEPSKAASLISTDPEIQESTVAYVASTDPSTSVPETTTKPDMLEASATSTPEKIVTSTPVAAAAPTAYKILAYDSSTLQMTEANTTSSLSSSSGIDTDPPLHPTEVLPRLNNPAKFLPYFQSLQDQGYEIVKGGGDMLMFKKVRDGVSPTEPITENLSKKETTAQAGMVESPSNAGASTEPTSAGPATTTSAGPKVRRQEDVFSGSGQTWHHESAGGQGSGNTGESTEGIWSRFKRGVKRALWAGLGTAGICYAIGAVAESFGAQQPVIEERGQRRMGRPGIYSTESSR